MLTAIGPATEDFRRWMDEQMALSRTTLVPGERFVSASDTRRK